VTTGAAQAARTRQALEAWQAQLRACRRCPDMKGPVVHGAPVLSRVYLLGQAPGVREGAAGRPFAWTAGKTLFKWLQGATGADEATIRARVYFSAVCRCFPGKAASGGGDRLPDADEVASCRPWVEGEVRLLRPQLVLPVGALAIAQALGLPRPPPLKDVVGQVVRRDFHGVTADVLPLPHPSGASTWHRMEPGKSLLQVALRQLAAHPAMREALALAGDAS
jgi:uracil-DNA glycosylase